MARRIDTGDPGARTLSRGPAFLYIAPCAYEDLLKLGFSRTPLERLRAFHPRFFEVFDLGRTLLVETESVADARGLENGLRPALAAYNAPAPLTIRDAAAGSTEWYRGAYGLLDDAVGRLSDRGFIVHRPARPWFADAVAARSTVLYEWCDAVLSPDELDGISGRTPIQTAVRDELDACAACGLDVAERVSPRVLAWYLGQN